MCETYVPPELQNNNTNNNNTKEFITSRLSQKTYTSHGCDTRTSSVVVCVYTGDVLACMRMVEQKGGG